MDMTTLHATRGARQRNLNSVSVAALAGALLTIAAPQAATAQAAPPPADTKTDTADIVVTGYRASLRNAIAVKKISTSIVESLSAEDVGKLPDVSIADALARLPGVSVQTQAGRGQLLSIRGFSGDFTQALLNHREIATIDDNRRFQYDQLPGDIFNRVDVIKTSSAAQLGQGLAGTVDLMTIDPLSAKRTVSINVQGELNGYRKLNPDASNKGYKGTLIYVDKFANNTIGVSLGFSAINSPVQNKQYESWGYPSLNGGLVDGGAKWFANTNILKRQVGFGHIVYKPDNKFEMSVDAMYSNYAYKEYQRGLEVPLVWGGVPATNVTVANGFVTSATFNPIYAVQRNNFNTRDATTLALGGNIKYGLSDSVRLVVDASYSRAHRHDNATETYSGTGYAKSGVADTATIALQPNGTYTFKPTLNYTDTGLFKLTDPQGWGYYTSPVVQAGYSNQPDFTDTIKALRASLDGHINAGIIKSWEVGVNYADRTKVNHFTGFYLVPPTGTNAVAIPSSIVVGSVTPFNVLGNTIAYNIPAAVALLTGSFQNKQPSEATKQWYVNEKTLTGYAQLNLDGVVGSLPVSGNIGAQVVYTNQTSTGFAASSISVIVPTYYNTKYTYVLPSANLKIEVGHNTFVHIAASRTLARARLLDENASYSVNYLQNSGLYDANGKAYVLGAGGGNPVLRPYFSDNVDLSLEKYFAHNQGLISVAAYYKAISNFVEPNKAYLADLSAFAALVPPPPTVAAGSYTLNGPVVSPANSGRGYVQGVEASATVPFNIMNSALDGFGALGSVAYTDSSIRYSTGSPVTLPGLSDWVAKGQIYFEKWGFNARTSYEYRSHFLGEYLAFGAQLQLKSTKARSTVDAQIGYDFKAGPLNGLSLYVQGKNLTNSAFVTYTNNDPRQIINYETYGPTYLAGATFKF
jgi:iron complex outermembrane receptor protein